MADSCPGHGKGAQRDLMRLAGNALAGVAERCRVRDTWQVIHGTALPGLVQPPTDTLFLALFAHDFSLL